MDAQTVLRARDRYLAANGFSVDEYSAPRTHATFLFVDFTVPNTPHHAWAIRLHDLHHVATGYGTDLAGEGEISAWELSNGLGGIDLYVRSIIVVGALVGFLVSPRRSIRAWRSGRNARPLWSLALAYDDLLALSVAQLRERVGVPANGLVQSPQGRHRRAPRSSRSPFEQMDNPT